MEEGSLQISQLHTIADPKSEAKGSRKQYQYQKETIQKRTRSQSISIDRDASDRSRNTGRGRRMERRSTNTSLSPFCGKTTSPKIEMKANMLDEKKFFVVELVDFMKSGTESPRSVSLSRSTSGFHPEGEGSIARNARSLSRNRKHSKEAVSSKLSPPLDEEIKSPVLICRYCDDEFSSRFDLNEHLVVFHKMKYNTAVLPPSPPPTNPSTSEERKSIMKNPEVERKSVSFGRGESDNPDVQAMTDNVLSSTTSFEHMKDAKISVKKAQKKSRAQKPKDEAKQISHSTPTIDAKSNKGIESKEDSKPSIENTRRTFICDENLRTDAIPENIENETVAEKRMKKTRKRSISNSDHETSRSRSTRSSVQEIYPSIDLHSDIEIKTITKTTTKSIRKRSVSLSGTESDCSDQQPLNDISPSSKVVVYETVCPRKDTDDCTKRKSATVGCNFPMFKESDTSIVIDIPPHSLNLADTNKSETGDQTRMKKKQKKTNSSGTKLKDDSSKGHLTDLQVNSVTSATFHESSEILPDVISNTTSVTVTKEKEVAKSSFNENAADLFKAFNLKKVSVTVKKCDANKSTLSKYIPKNYKSVPIIERKIELPIERESNLVKPAIKVRPYIKDLKKQDEHCVNSEHTYGSYKEKAQNLSTGKETCEMSKSQTDHENDLDVHEKEKNLPNSDSSHLEPIQEKEFVASLYSNKEVLDSSIDSFSNIKTNIESQTSVMKGNETSILDSSYNNKDFEMDADIEDDVLKDFMEQEQIRLDVSSEEQGLLFKDFVEQEQLCLDDGQAELIDSSLIVDLSSATFSAELDECYYNKAKLEAKIDLVYKKYITKHVTNLRTYSKNSVEFNASNEAVLGVESELKVNEKNIAKQAINEEKKMSQQSKENTNSATTRSEKLNKKTLMNTQSEYTATKKPESTALERQSLLPKLPVDVDKDIEKPKVEKNLKSVDIENKEIMSVESVEMNCVTPTPEKLNKKTSKKSQSECTASKNLESTALEQQSALSKLPVNVDQDTEMPQVEMNHNSVDTENVEIASVESVAINSLTPRPEKKLHKKTSKNSKSECTASKKLESTALEQQSALSKLLVNVDKDTEMPQVEMNINSVDTENKEIMSVESVEMNCVTPRPEKLNKKTFKKSQSECTASKKLESTALEKQSALSKLPVNVDQDTEMPQVEMNHNSVDTENEEITSVESVAINSLTPRPEKKLHKKTSKNSKSECTASKKLESTALEQQSALSKLPVNVDKDTEMPQVEMNINSVDTENKEIISDESVTIDSGKLSKKTLNKTKSECNASKKLESTTLEQQSVFSKLPINIDQDTVVPQLEINSKSVDTENKEITSVESVAINTETPRPEKKLHKKTSKNSKSEYTASKKLESLLSKLPVDVDQNTDVPQLDSVTQSPENVDAKSKEIISTETVATNINGSYDNSAKILETIDSVINKVRSENISHEVVSCDETLEINPCSETEDVCNEESNKTSPTEPKSHHSIKIKLKRKRTWLQSVDTPLEECGSLFCDSTQTDDSEPAVKSRKKVESKNTKETVNPHAVEKSKTPVLKLKKVPFSTFTFHNGLRLKFLGSKSKPYWKIKDKHSKATDEIRETFKAYKSSEHNRRKELKMHEKEGIDKETLKHDNIERKNSNFQTIVENNHGEKNVKSKEVASKTCSETEILPNKSTIHDYDEVNNNTICSDDERNMTTEMKCLQNINRVNMEQKVKETPKEVKKDGLKTKKKKDHTNSGSERKIRDDPSKTCSDTKTLTNEITMHDNDEENDNTIRCDSESDTNPETLQNVDGVTVDQKVKETPEKVKKERLKTKIKKDHTKSERKSSKVLKVKILGKKEKVNKEHQLTEFDRVMLNSGKDRKVNLKLAKRSNSIVRRKSDDSESPLESNRDIIFKKSKKRKPVIEDNVSLLSKSKIAQSILNKTEKERKSNEEEIPDFPPITDFESFSFPPLSASKLATKSVNKSPNKHKTSDKSSMKNLMKTLESVGSVRDMINNTKSTRLKDPKSTRLKDIVNGDGLIDLRSPFDSSSSVSFPQSPFINTLRPLESPFGKTDSLKPTNLFKPVSSVAHSEELQGLNKTGVSTEKERDISRNSFSLRPEHFPGESKGSDMNAASRLKQPNFFTDSAFSSPKSFQSGFLSPVSGAFMSNKLPAKPVLISSTPNINLTSVSSPSRKRSFPFSPDGPAEKQQLLEPIDRLFPDISGVGPEAPEEYESSSGGDGEMQKTFMSKQKHRVCI